MSDNYNTNSVPHSIPGGTVQLYNGGGASQGVFIFENFDPTRPKNIIERPNQFNGEGDWVDAGYKFNTASITLQIPKDPTAQGNVGWPNGDCDSNGDWYFLINSGFSSPGGGATEKWVLTDIGQKFDFGQYWKSTFACKRDIRYSS